MRKVGFLIAISGSRQSASRQPRPSPNQLPAYDSFHKRPYPEAQTACTDFRCLSPFTILFHYAPERQEVLEDQTCQHVFR